MSEDLPNRLNEHLKNLRKADTQSAAIAWMTAAYKLMEESIEALKEKPVTSTIERLIFIPSDQKIEVVQEIPQEVLPIIHRMPPPPTGKAWTRHDTVMLQRAKLIYQPPIPDPPTKPLPEPQRLPMTGAQRNASMMRKLQLIQRKGR